MGDIIVFLIIIIAVGLVIYRMIRDKKKGKSMSCGCNCENCNMPCHK